MAAVALSGLPALAQTHALAQAPHRAVTPSGWSVVGFAEAGSTPISSLRASDNALTSIGVDGVNVSRDGTHVSAVSSDALRLLHHAHATHHTADLLVGNYDDKLGDFSPKIGDALLGSRSHMRAVVRQLGAEVRRHHWDGITLDLESLDDKHPAALSSLVAQLAHELGSQRSVSICLMATPSHYASLGYDLGSLGRAADHIILMAYDQHGPTWSGAGPVGGTPWVTASLAPLLAAVPRQKIELGIAGYGYTWPRHGTGEQVSDSAARADAARGGGGAVWNARQQEWHTVTHSGTRIWWSDARTISARERLARSEHLGGVAVWSLALSDPLPVAN